MAAPSSSSASSASPSSSAAGGAPSPANAASLFSAVSSDDPDAVRRLLEAKVDPNVMSLGTDAGSGTGQLKGKAGAVPLIEAARGGKDEITSLLLKGSAYIDQQDRLGFTPLYAAVESGHKVPSHSVHARAF